MSRTITALFDTRADAEAGRQRLLDAHLDADNVNIHDKSSIGDAAYSSHQEPGMWASIKNAFLPDEDRHTYEEGVRRGGFLLTADVDEQQADEAVRALEHDDAKGIDIDERAGQWKSQGWQQPVTGAAAGIAARSAVGGAASATETGDDQARFNVVEEQLTVGKREVDRGGVRVRSYVTEKPVHEQISLRDERIRIERHPVNRLVGEDAFKEQTIELTETGEEAVVAKTARVVEEVLVSKTVEERVEEITDTVRRTDVVVEELDDAGLARNTGKPGKPGVGKI